MVYYILAIIAVATLIALGVIFRRQIMANRKRNLNYHDFSHYAVLNVAIDFLAFKIVHFCQIILKKFYLFTLHFIKNSVATARYAIVKMEKHFNQIVDSAPEPEAIHRTNKASSFLKEIKEHKEAAMADFQNPDSSK